MPVNIGPQIGIDGYADFTRSMKNIISQSKELASEMKLVTSSFDKNDASQEKLAAQMQVLNKQIDLQSKRVDLLADRYSESEKKVSELRSALQKAVQEYGETSKEAQSTAAALDRQEAAASRAKTGYLNATTALNKMQAEMGQLTSQASQVRTPLERLNETISKQESDLQSLKNQYADAVLEFGKGSSSARRLQGEIKELSSDLSKNKKRLTDATSEVDRLGDEYDDAGRQAASFGDIVAGSFVGNVLADLASEAGSALMSLGADAISAADSLTKFESTMDFAGFDSKTIQETEKAMQDYASRTVYDLETVSNTVAQLGANGVDNFEALTEAAGNLNAVAGGNADTFSSVAMVLTQTAGAGKLTTENWNQLTDAIPGASGVLQQAMLDAGAYTGNFREAMEEGEISAEEFNAAIMELGNSDAAKQAATSVDTVEGAVGNLQATITDLITSFLANGGTEMITGFINALNAGFQQLGAWISANQDQIMDFAQNAFTGIMGFGKFIVDNWETIVSDLAIIGAGIAALKLAQFATDIGNIISGASTLTETFPALGGAVTLLTGPFGAVIAVVSGVLLLINTFGDQIKAVLQSVDDFLQNVFAVDLTQIFGPALGGVLTGFLNVFEGVWTAIKGILDGVIDIVRGVFTADWERAWNGVVEIFSGLFDGIASIFKGVINTIIGLLNGLLGKANGLIDGINLIPGVDIPHIPTIPLLAKGGIVRSGSAIVGEAGPELMTVLGNRTIVQPLPAGAVAFGGGRYSAAAQVRDVNITVYGAEGQDVNQLAEVIMQKIETAANQREAVW